MSESVLVQAQRTGPIRTETLEGRRHKVFPATLVQEQVLNNNLGKTFLPASEIQKSVDAWNRIPVVLRHPSRRGMPVSARDPEVLDARRVGDVFRARFEDGALKAEVWVDMERVGALEDAEDVVNRVERGEPGELSTGFATAVEETSGVHNGQPFDKTLRGVGPDHLALLIEETGACSVTDGCGLGVNHDGTCDCGGNVDEEQVANSIWARLMALVTNQEDTMDRESVIAALQDAGCPLSEERLAELEDEELDSLVAYHEAEGAAPEPTAEDAEASEALLEEIQSLKSEVAELKEATEPAVQERERKRAELVERLASNDRCAFEKDDLGAMSMAQLNKLADTVQVRSYAARGGPKRSAENTETQFMRPKPHWETDEDGED